MGNLPREERFELVCSDNTSLKISLYTRFPTEHDEDIYNYFLRCTEARKYLYGRVRQQRQSNGATVLIYHPAITFPIILGPQTTDAQWCQYLTHWLTTFQDPRLVPSSTAIVQSSAPPSAPVAPAH